MRLHSILDHKGAQAIFRRKKKKLMEKVQDTMMSTAAAGLSVASTILAGLMAVLILGGVILLIAIFVLWGAALRGPGLPAWTILCSQLGFDVINI